MSMKAGFTVRSNDNLENQAHLDRDIIFVCYKINLNYMINTI